MKKVLKAFVVMFLMATVLNASSLKESLNVDGYNLELTSKRDLSAGSNEFFVKITKDGKEVSDTDEFTLCVNNYRATGGGNFNMLKDAPVVKEIPSSMVELLADYIMEHKVVDFVPVHNIKVEK